MSDDAVTLLPDPDSPTIPSVSPAATEKLTPSTARRMPASVKNWVCRSRTSRTGLADAVETGEELTDGNGWSMGTHHRLRDLGSSQSRIPSPRKLKPTTMDRMARPGKVATHHCSISSRPSDTIEPHSGVGGTTPR